MPKLQNLGLISCIRNQTKYVALTFVNNKEHPDSALDEFMKCLLPIIDTHAFVKN
jgi:hypothetical protein